ncbi:MAG: hypothetical protein ABI742_07430 [Gemmatimonadota bacterium]
MRASLARIGAVVRADVLIRVRRPSSIAVFLALCALAYLWVPDLSSGRTLMQVDGHRALYNSATIAIATAGLATLLLGMLGFYLVSNTVRRDIISRTGFVIAAMPVRSAEYLAGKFLGNATFLGLVILGYMVNVMGMHLLRGEVPIEPWVYLSIYLAMAGPAILVISGLALLFECVRPLSGRVGDVLYFFVWVAMVSLAAASDGAPGEQWQRFTDILGMLFMLQQVRGGQELQGVSIGQSSFDPSKAPWIFTGVHWTWPVIEARLAAALLAVPLLLLALGFFVRFDPARIKGGTTHVRVGILGRINRWLKPLTRVLLPLAGRGGGLGGIALGEFTLTLMLSPLALVWWVGLSGWALVASRSSLTEAVLPVTFVAITTIIADITTRDSSAGTTALLYSLPRVRRGFVVTKFLGAALTALAFLIVPLLRLGFESPSSALSLAIGGLFVSAAAVSLGRLTGSSKAFTGLFLLFLYVVLSSKGDPGLDFAGWNGVETASARLGYLLAGVAFVAVAMIRHLAEGRRS